MYEHCMSPVSHEKVYLISRVGFDRCTDIFFAFLGSLSLSRHQQLADDLDYIDNIITVCLKAQYRGRRGTNTQGSHLGLRSTDQHRHEFLLATCDNSTALWSRDQVVMPSRSRGNVITTPMVPHGMG